MGKFRNMINKIIRSGKEIPREAAAEINEGEVRELIEEALDTWYGSYSPKYYRRRDEGMKSGILDGYSYSWTGKKIIVDVNGSMVPTPERGTFSGEKIFDTDFIGGHHGSESGYASTPPPEIYEPKLDEMSDEIMQKVSDRYWHDL